MWGFPWQSNPYCSLVLGSQAVRSRRDDDTSLAGSHRAPVWNQEFQFLVEDPMSQVRTLFLHSFNDCQVSHLLAAFLVCSRICFVHARLVQQASQQVYVL